MMRTRHIVALIGVIVAGFLIKHFVFPFGEVAADVRPAATMDVMQMHRHVIANLPAQAMHDMTFVFDSDDARR